METELTDERGMPLPHALPDALRNAIPVEADEDGWVIGERPDDADEIEVDDE